MKTGLRPLLITPGNAFKIYFQIRGKRSISRLMKELCQKYAKNVQEGGGRLPHLNTLKKWSVKYNWQEKVKQWDAKKDAKSEDATIEKVAMEDEKILSICKVWINIFAQNAKGRPFKDKDGNVVFDKKTGQPIMVPPYIDAFGFKAIWEIYQIVRGQVTECIAFTRDDEELLTILDGVDKKTRRKIFKHLAQIDAIRRHYQNVIKNKS